MSRRFKFGTDQFALRVDSYKDKNLFSEMASAIATGHSEAILTGEVAGWVVINMTDQNQRKVTAGVHHINQIFRN